MDKYKSFAIKGMCVLIFLALLYLFFNFALGIIFPFAVAFFVAAVTRNVTNRLCEKRKISKPFATFFVVTLFIVVIACVCTACISLIINELSSIASATLKNLENDDNFISKIFIFIEGLKEKFPFLNKILPGVDESIYNIAVNMVKSSIEGLSTKITTALAGFITSLPSFIITVIVILLSIFYFSKDYDKISKSILELFPEKASKRLPKIKNNVITVTLKFAKAYAILLAITFFEVFVGLMILRVNSPFILAMLIAIIDLLPVLGVGVVLIPWGIFEIVCSNTYLGIGLLVLFVICYTVRQLAEPKILSSQMNVHPLITLFSMYAGLKLFGLSGIIFAPLVVFMIKAVYEEIKKEKTVENNDQL